LGICPELALSQEVSARKTSDGRKRKEDEIRS